MPRAERAAHAGGQGCPRSVSDAETFDGLLQDSNAFVELIDRHEFAGAMGYANVAGTEDDGVGAEIDQAGRFGAECDCSGLLTGRLFKKLHQLRVGPRLETFISATSVDFANKVGVLPVKICDGLPDKIQGIVRLLSGNRSPFEREAAFSRDDVLCRAALD